MAPYLREANWLAAILRRQCPALRFAVVVERRGGHGALHEAMRQFLACGTVKVYVRDLTSLGHSATALRSGVWPVERIRVLDEAGDAFVELPPDFIDSRVNLSADVGEDYYLLTSAYVKERHAARRLM